MSKRDNKGRYNTKHLYFKKSDERHIKAFEILSSKPNSTEYVVDAIIEKESGISQKEMSIDEAFEIVKSVIASYQSADIYKERREITQKTKEKPNANDNNNDIASSNTNVKHNKAHDELYKNFSTAFGTSDDEE